MRVIRSHNCEGQTEGSGVPLLYGFDLAAVELQVAGPGERLRGKSYLDAVVAQPLSEATCDEHEAAAPHLALAEGLQLLELVGVPGVEAHSGGHRGRPAFERVLPGPRVREQLSCALDVVGEAGGDQSGGLGEEGALQVVVGSRRVPVLEEVLLAQLQQRLDGLSLGRAEQSCVLPQRLGPGLVKGPQR